MGRRRRSRIGRPGGGVSPDGVGFEALLCVGGQTVSAALFRPLASSGTTAVGLGGGSVLARCLSVCSWGRGRRALRDGWRVVRARAWRCDTENKGETARTGRGGWGLEEENGAKTRCDGVGQVRQGGGHVETWVVRTTRIGVGEASRDEAFRRREREDGEGRARKGHRRGSRLDGFAKRHRRLGSLGRLLASRGEFGPRAQSRAGRSNDAGAATTRSLGVRRTQVPCILCADGSTEDTEVGCWPAYEYNRY